MNGQRQGKKGGRRNIARKNEWRGDREGKVRRLIYVRERERMERKTEQDWSKDQYSEGERTEGDTERRIRRRGRKQ